MSLEASIIVCTYNRCKSLERLLVSIQNQENVNGLPSECLIIDNNSNDQTKIIVDRFQKNIQGLKYCFEPNQGKGFALNHAITLARGKLLLFTDDDVELSKTWLYKYANAAETNPEYDWFGGKIEPLWPQGKPKWYKKSKRKEYYDGYFIRYQLSDHSRPYEDQDQYPFGASMAIRSRVFTRIGQFRTDIGPNKRLRVVGEDTEIIERSINSGFLGYYVHDSVCHHQLDKKRLRLWSFFMYGVGRGVGHFHLYKGNQKGSLRRSVIQLSKGIIQFFMFKGDNYRVALINTGIEVGKLWVAYQAWIRNTKSSGKQ